MVRFNIIYLYALSVFIGCSLAEPRCVFFQMIFVMSALRAVYNAEGKPNAEVKQHMYVALQFAFGSLVPFLYLIFITGMK